MDMEVKKNPNVIKKIILLGDGAVGKTSLLNKYCDNCFKEPLPTIGKK